MVEQRLIDFLKSETAKGIPIEHIGQRLVSGGWKEADVNEGIRIVQQEAFSSAPAPRAMPIQAQPFVNASSQAPMSQPSSLLRPSPEAISKIVPPDNSKPAIMVPIIIVLVVLAIIGAAMLFPHIKGMFKTGTSENASDSFQVVDCGTSEECFSSYMATCTKAKATITEEQSTYVEVIEGFKGDDCLLTMWYTQIGAQDQDLMGDWEGKAMTCKVPQSHLSDYKNYLQDYVIFEQCEGTLIDAMLEMMNAEAADMLQAMENASLSQN